MKRIFSMLCVLALMLGMIAVPAYATDAEGAVQQNRVVLSANAENLTVEEDTYIDLNGYNITGVTVKDGATLYVSDSQTDDYTVADGIYGKITDAEGNVQAAEGYVTINEEGALSYHKADLTLTSMTLRPAVAGVYYNSAFAADEVVAANVECYGVALSVIAEPTAENLDTLCGYSTIYGFEAGEKSGTLLSGIMTEGNTDFANNRNAAMNIYGRAYIKTAEGYTFGATASRNLKEQVEAIDAIFSQLNEAQSTAIVSLYSNYESVMENWNVPNMKHAAPKGDTVITVPVETEDGEVTETVTVEQDGVSITIPFGTLVTSDELTLTVTRLDASESEIEAGEGQTLMPFDVHVDGISAENTQPLTVALGKVMPENLNMGNYTVYHVEEDGTKEMTLVADAEDLTSHNQYVYTLDGELTLNMATFSVVAAVTDNDNAWNGTRNYEWYNTTADVLYIRNADQLAGFGAIVGGMDGQTQNSFAGKTVKLLADINIDDLTDEDGKKAPDGSNLVFYPIGYYNNTGSYEKKPGNVGPNGTAVSSGYKNFCGTFDGNGHTISNFYQNTWEMFGDYNDGYAGTPNHSRDGMGLFGRVYGGTVKNLTVKNFQSDGEFATTGVIAAYADGATFENIAIFDCNPRVYNIGNGGIVGCVGWYAIDANLTTNFKNITVDNTNKISALWGSYDVACGGILGQYYPTSGQTSAGTPKNGGVAFENCHVAAQMDVYNDVCANYQYYAYRYTGMLIGSVRENETIDGHSYPKMDGITAEDCTVHFGTWNDYYYCEIIDNTTASYTHDYQMSRLEEIKAINGTTITYLDGTTGTIPASGRANYVIVDYTKGHGTENATCYHFKNGEVWTHDMGGIDKGIDENGDGQDDLKEDKQHIYLEFNNLVTGYGWGVTTKGVGDLAGVAILDREVPNSVVKFESLVTELVNEKTYSIGELFKVKDQESEKPVGIVDANVQVTVSPYNPEEECNVVGEYVADSKNWTKGTLTFSGTGKVNITITDYYFCVPTTIPVTINERVAEEKFDVVMNNGDFLHRVGNSGTVALDKLFKAKDGIAVGTVSVTIEAVDGTGASGTYSNNAIQFNGTGVVKVTITDNDYCIPTELYLEVVDAVNAISATNATSNNVVLLNNCDLSSMTVSGRYTFYGNGFTMTYTGNGQYLNNGLKQGVVTVSDNGTLDNVHIKASIYPRAYMYYGSTLKGDYVQNGPSTVEGDRTRYHYQLSSVVAKDNATVSNCYIYGGRTNIFVDTGNVTIQDTVLECGVVANVQIQSTNEYTVTLENVTTIQYQVNPTLGDTSKVMLGSGVIVGPDTTSNPTIVLNGNFKQYNWVTAADADVVSDTMAKKLINGALEATAFNHTVNGQTASNLGIIFMNTEDDQIENNTGLPYELSNITMTDSGVSAEGQAYSLQNANADQIYSDCENADRATVNGDYLPTFSFDLGDQGISYDGSEDTRYIYGDKNGVTALYQDGDDPITLDLTKLATVYKYTGMPYEVTVSCKDANGEEIGRNNIVTLEGQGSYTLTFTVNDNIFYDQNGNSVTKSVERTYTVPLNLTVKEAQIKNAVVNITKTALDGVYNTVNFTDYELRIKFLDAISVTDYDNKGTGTTVNLSSNISSATLSPSGVNVFTTASTITITYTDGRVLTVNLSKISGSSPGTKTAKINTSGSVYFTTEGALNNKPTEASSQNKCTITSVSFKGNSGSTVTNDTAVTVTWALGSSSGCFTEGTMITLADGTKKPIEQITYEDELLAWDLNTGAYATTVPSLIESHEADEYRVINLKFADGTVSRIVVDHGFFDVGENKFVFIDEENVDSYIGHEFVQVGENGTYHSVELVGYEITVENVAYYTIQTAFYNNCIAENMFTLTSPPEGVDGWFDYFEIGEGMKYDEEKMQADIEKYGLYTYADFSDYVTYEQFVAFNGPYLKVLVGRGVLTYEDILALIATYVN